MVPSLLGAAAGQTTTSEAPIDPFATVTIVDPNRGMATDTLTISFAGGNGTLSGTGLTGSGGTYFLSGTAASITSELDALTFTPVDGVPNTSVTTTFTLSDLSSAFTTPTVNNTTTVIDSDPAVAQTIAGTVPGQTTTSEAPVSPFSTVTIGDANNDGTDTDTLSISYTAGDGTLSGSGLTGLAGSYSLTGTASVITGELDALTFTPAGAGTTTFTLSDLSKAFTTPAIDSNTTVTDTDLAAVAPTITGTVGGQTTTSEAPVSPFSGVTITDPNNGGADTNILTITFAGADGTLSGSGLAGSNGNYSLTGTAAGITGELDPLTFTPR